MQGIAEKANPSKSQLNRCEAHSSKDSCVGGGDFLTARVRSQLDGISDCDFTAMDNEAIQGQFTVEFLHNFL